MKSLGMQEEVKTVNHQPKLLAADLLFDISPDNNNNNNKSIYIVPNQSRLLLDTLQNMAN